MFGKAKARKAAKKAAEEQLALAKKEELEAKDKSRSEHLHQLQLSLANLLEDNAELETERNAMDDELVAVRQVSSARLRAAELESRALKEQLQQANMKRDTLAQELKDAVDHHQADKTDMKLKQQQINAEMKQQLRKSYEEHETEQTTMRQELDQINLLLNDATKTIHFTRQTELQTNKRLEHLQQTIDALKSEQQLAISQRNELEAQLEAAVLISSEEKDTSDHTIKNLQNTNSTLTNAQMVLTKKMNQIQTDSDALQLNVSETIERYELEKKSLLNKMAIMSAQHVEEMNQNVNTMTNAFDVEKEQIMQQCHQQLETLTMKQTQELNPRGNDLENKTGVEAEVKQESHAATVAAASDGDGNSAPPSYAHVLNNKTNETSTGVVVRQANVVDNNTATTTAATENAIEAAVECIVFDNDDMDDDGSNNTNLNRANALIEQSYHLKMHALNATIVSQQEQLEQFELTLHSVRKQHENTIAQLADKTLNNKSKQQDSSSTSSSNYDKNNDPRVVNKIRASDHHFAIKRTVKAVFDGSSRPLGIGLGQLSKDSQLTIIRSLRFEADAGSKGKGKIHTGVAIHNEGARARNRRAIQMGYTVMQEIEIGMCLLSINKILTGPMTYEDMITAIKQLPRPLELEFGVLESKLAQKKDERR